MTTSTPLVFSRNDAGTLSVEFQDNGSSLDLGANGVAFTMGSYSTSLTVDDAANGLASLQITAATLATFRPGLYDARITIQGNVPTLVSAFINADTSTGDGATYNNSIIIDVDTSDVCIANSGGSGGVPGPPGDSAYQVWLDAGNTGTSQDFLDSLQGQPGNDGADGAPGQDGADGAPGQDGNDGAPGQDGNDGAPGQDGADGADGDDGPAVTIATGTGAPPSSWISSATIGDFYVRTG